MNKIHLVLSFLLVVILFSACKEEKKASKVTTAPVAFEKEGEAFLVSADKGDTLKQLQIEIADNDYERETGLMYRKKMEEDHGMLFIFEDEAPRGFYMKNTYIPLDLIFLDADNKIVHISPDAKPQSHETIPSNAPAQYVLEVNAGLSEQWNLKVGDSLILRTKE